MNDDPEHQYARARKKIQDRVVETSGRVHNGAWGKTGCEGYTMWRAMGQIVYERVHQRVWRMFSRPEL